MLFLCSGSSLHIDKQNKGHEGFVLKVFQRRSQYAEQKFGNYAQILYRNVCLNM